MKPLKEYWPILVAAAAIIFSAGGVWIRLGAIEESVVKVVEKMDKLPSQYVTRAEFDTYVRMNASQSK